jgi:hypothetical protein
MRSRDSRQRNTIRPLGVRRVQTIVRDRNRRVHATRNRELNLKTAHVSLRFVAHVNSNCPVSSDRT